MTNHPLGEMHHNEPMSQHTSWRTGGLAERYFKPKNKDALIRFMQQLPRDEPVFWMGLGSNLLVRDGGIRGTVIAHTGRLNTLRCVSDDRCYVEVGVPCAKVARFTAKQHLTGAEFLAGIPGTMGGALAMNAGAFGGETWVLVHSVQMLQRDGIVRERPPGDFHIGYRQITRAPDEWFLSAILQLQQTADAEGLNRIKRLLSRRSATQPTNKPTCGSVFKNPQGQHAAKLIDALGLKGYRIGGACVSMKHANFIENVAQATSREIEALITYIQSKVEDETGIKLQPEVKIVGNSE